MSNDYRQLDKGSVLLLQVVKSFTLFSNGKIHILHTFRKFQKGKIIPQKQGSAFISIGAFIRNFMVYNHVNKNIKEFINFHLISKYM